MLYNSFSPILNPAGPAEIVIVESYTRVSVDGNFMVPTNHPAIQFAIKSWKVVHMATALDKPTWELLSESFESANLRFSADDAIRRWQILASHPGSSRMYP